MNTDHSRPGMNATGAADDVGPVAGPRDIVMVNGNGKFADRVSSFMVGGIAADDNVDDFGLPGFVVGDQPLGAGVVYRVWHGAVGQW